MPYKISGTLNEDSRVIIIEESGWTIESNTQESAGSYEVEVASGEKSVVDRSAEGQCVGFGNVTAIESAPASGDRGVFDGGYDTNETNVIEYITISTTGNASDFGDLTSSIATSGGRGKLGACSNS